MDGLCGSRKGHAVREPGERCLIPFDTAARGWSPPRHCRHPPSCVPGSAVAPIVRRLRVMNRLDRPQFPADPGSLAHAQTQHPVHPKDGAVPPVPLGGRLLRLADDPHRFLETGIWGGREKAPPEEDRLQGVSGCSPRPDALRSQPASSEGDDGEPTRAPADLLEEL